MEQEQLIYEQEEVIWAKIRGYPWWPAFISELHQDESDQIEYTVVFFGDNTNSRLDGSKLRKFIDNYIECFSKAKNHRKLMMSIMMAQDKLRQNDQNVEIFEELRSRVRNKKGKPPPKENLQSSEHVSEPGQFKNKIKTNPNQIYEEPQESPKQLLQQQIKNKQKPQAKERHQAVVKERNKPIAKERHKLIVQERHKVIVQERNQPKKKSRRKVQLSEESIQEQQVESEMKAENEEADLEKMKREKEQKQQQFSKKASVGFHTYQMSIEVKNGQIIQRKRSEVIMKVQQRQVQERLKTDEKEQSCKHKEEQQLKSICQELHADQTSTKKRSRKIKVEKQAVEAAEKEQNSQKLQIQSNNKNSTQKEAKKNKITKEITKEINKDISKEIQLPDLEKHATQPLPEKQGSQIEVEASEQIINEDQQSISSQFAKVKRKGRSFSLGQSVTTTCRPIIFARKRGRPKKIDAVREMDQDADSQKQDKNENIPNLKKKHIRKVLVGCKQPQRPKQKSLADQAVINGVKKLLHNRRALIEFLSQSTINIDNVKQILDMDVSNILQEGVINDQVIHLLELFRAALLYKYFPDDVKHRKKYQKLLKKKHFELEVQEVEDNVEQLPQIRKKTINKVKKFLGLVTAEQPKLKQISQKIEELIYVIDEDLGNHYCRIAFQVLSALKQKKQNYQQIIRKLELRFYD